MIKLCGQTKRHPTYSWWCWRKDGLFLSIHVLLKSSSRTKNSPKIVLCSMQQWKTSVQYRRRIFCLAALFSSFCQEMFDWMNGNGKCLMPMLFRWTDISIDDYRFSYRIWTRFLFNTDSAAIQMVLKSCVGEMKKPEHPTSIHRTHKYLAHILVVAV